MADDMGEKTEAPSGRRLAEARNRGQIPKSMDLSGSVDLIAAVIITAYFGKDLMSNSLGLLRAILSGEAPGAGDGLDGIDELLVYTALHAIRIAAPMLGLMFIAVYAGQIFQVGWLITTEPIMPKLDRLNPLNGLKRLLGTRNVVKTLISFVKLILVCTVAVISIGRGMASLAVLPRFEILAGFAHMGQLLLDMIIWILLIMFIIGLADYVYQRWQHTKDLRMTKQEVKDEFKSMEGDPGMRGKRIRMARDIVMQRMRQDVPRADVIVTNPTHFSVALRYDTNTMSAPQVVAKGADYLAFRIREIAVANGVPIVEKPALARALYANARVGQQIQPEYFEAVAEVLAYVYRIAGKAA